MKNHKQKNWLTGVGMIIASSLLVNSAAQATNFELWIPDQSNSVPGETTKGVAGSYLHIVDRSDIRRLAPPGDFTGSTALPLFECFGTDGDGVPSANPGAPSTACDMNIVFPSTLTACAGAGAPSSEGTLGTVARLHDISTGPLSQYVSLSFFSPGGGYVGIMDGTTKRAIALWRITDSSAGSGQSAHAVHWNAHGTALLVANLHGRILERIDISRGLDGEITTANFNRNASLSMASAVVERQAISYQDDPGCNMAGSLISEVSGSYDTTPTPAAPGGAMGDTFVSILGPGGATTTWCKQDGCPTPGAFNAERGSNIVKYPNVASNGLVFTTFNGGGLLVADSTVTPMEIVGHYACTDQNISIFGSQGINGAGFLGIELGGQMFLNHGISSAPPGAVHSHFEIVSLPLNFTKFGGLVQPINFPAPTSVYEDAGGIFNNCNAFGPAAVDPSQIMTDGAGNVLAAPSVRHDSHGITPTFSGHYLHNSDRIQNEVQVIQFSAKPANTFKPYSLMSNDGSAGGPAGPCLAMSVTDHMGFPLNDPAGGLMATSTWSDYLFVALRGPAPVTTTHASQGSCPGVGVIRLSESGDTGYLEKVIRTSNTQDTALVGTIPGGVDYTGAERSDIHGIAVRSY